MWQVIIVISRLKFSIENTIFTCHTAPPIPKGGDANCVHSEEKGGEPYESTL